MKVTVIEPHGFCAGVTGAIRKALGLSDSASGRVYCLHELVHNELVVAELKSKGFVFVESIDEVPAGSTVLFSAHGVSPAVREAAAARGLAVVDATCPFVTRVHKSARAFADRGLPVVVIGNAKHVETKGILGEVPDSVVVESPEGVDAVAIAPGTRIGVVSQTTMNADTVKTIVARLGERYAVETMAVVCNATKERQDAVKAFDGDAVLVLGSANSSNTRKLCDVAKVKTYRAATIAEVNALDFAGVEHLGITSGASTPETFFREVVAAVLARSAV